MKIEFKNSGSSISYWVVTRKDGTQLFFGNTADSRIEAVGHGKQARAWALNKVLDVHGNYYEVEYEEDSIGGDYYPKVIAYTENENSLISKTKEVVFSYKTRTDQRVIEKTSEIVADQLLTSIAVNLDSKLLKEYEFNYENTGTTYRSKLINIEQSGDTESGTPKTSSFNWQIGGNGSFSDTTQQRNTYLKDSAAQHWIGDVNGDGFSDLIFWQPSYGYVYIQLGQIDGNFSETRLTVDTGLGYPEVQHWFTDINGDGRTDMVMWRPGFGYIYTLLGQTNGVFSGTGVTFDTGLGAPDAQHWFSDVNGDGFSDMIIWSPGTGNIGVNFGQSDGTFSPAGIATDTGLGYPSTEHWFTDINGDGRTDMVMWGPGSGNIYTLLGQENGKFTGTGVTFDTGLGSPDTKHWFNDVNGDGLSDMILWLPGYGNIGVNFGQSDGTFSPVGISTDTGLGYTNVEHWFSDINGDGRNDMVLWQSGYGYIYTWLGQTDGSFSGSGTKLDTYIGYQSTIHNFGDINGDGKNDLIIWYPESEYVSSTLGDSTSDALDIISTVTLPSGATITPTYNPAPQVSGAIDPSDSTYPNISNASARNLVTSLAITDGNGNTYTTAYDYHNGKFHTGVPTERQGLGFEWIKKTKPDGTYNINYYYQEDALHYAGAVKRSESYGSDGKLYGATENSYAVEEVLEAPFDYHPVNFIKKTDTYGYNFNGVTASDWDSMKGMSGIRKTHQSYEYDEKGNLIRIFDEGDVSDPSDDMLTVSSYLSNSSNYISALEYKKIYSYGLEESSFNAGSLESSANLVSDVDYYYDGLESYRGIGDFGQVSKVVAYSGETDQSRYPDKTNEFTYDTYGNVKTIKDGKGNTKIFNYDSVYHSAIQSAENALGQTTQTVGYDDLMRPEYIRDMNDNYTWQTYDEFGRIIQIADGDASGPGTVFSRNFFSDTAATPGSPQWVKKETYLPENPNDFLEEYSYFDGLGRLLQKKQEGIDVTGTLVWVTVDYHYDIVSRIQRVSEPYESSTSSFSLNDWNTSRNETIYYMDEIGRMNQIDYFQGISEYFHYGITDKTTLNFNSESPEDSQITYETMDGRSRISYTYPKGNYSPSSFSESDKTNWIYKASNTTARDGSILQELSAEDFDYGRSGNTTQIWNDNLGRKKSFDDPDMGVWEYSYDVNGNMKSQIDAKGNILTMEYDALNRVIIKYGANTVYYNYDGLTNDRSASDGKDHGSSVNGLLTSISFGDGAYQEDYYYDSTNDIYKISKTIEDKTRIYTINKDEIGRITSEILPGSDSETLSHSYDTVGNIETLMNDQGKTYISDLKYNIFGIIEGFSQGDTTVTDYTYNDKYHLTNINITNETGQIANMGFGYDNYGNLKEKTFSDDFHNVYSEAYIYDDLFRLSQAVSVGLYGTKTYKYDSYNNMLNNDGRIYQYDGTNPEDGGPHAVQEIQNASGDTLKTYEYDDNGNITKITGQSTVLIRAKGEGVVSNPPRMELWINGEGPQTIWNVTEEEYNTYTWHGYIPSGSAVSVVFANDNSDGGVNTKLYVDYISINGVILQSESSDVTYDQGGYSSGCFDGEDTLAGQEAMTLEGALHYLLPSEAEAVTRELQYDSENRLISIMDNGTVTAKYHYDDSGQRIMKTENGVKTYYFFSNYEEEYDESTGDLIQATTYYFANGQRIAQRSNGEISYYHTDHLGSAVRVTDEEGNITQSVAYTPFGKEAWFSGKGVTNYTFTGQESDSSGFMYYGARYYDPDLARFLQPDTYLDGMNRYSYCQNNPVIYSDPTGNWSLGSGIVFGWTKDHGWHIGTGLAFDFQDEVDWGVNLSAVYNFKDNSFSDTASIAGSYGIIYGNIGYSYNTKTGHSMNAGLGVNGGEIPIGAEIGLSMYWGKDGNFTGSILSMKAYVGPSWGNVGVGHDLGFGEMGGDTYIEATFFGGYVRKGEKSGFSYGFEGKVEYRHDSESEYPNILTNSYKDDMAQAILDVGELTNILETDFDKACFLRYWYGDGDDNITPYSVIQDLQQDITAHSGTFGNMSESSYFINEVGQLIYLKDNYNFDSKEKGVRTRKNELATRATSVVGFIFRAHTYNNIYTK